MIYAKIYLDGGDKTEYLVFDSVSASDDIHCNLAGEHKNSLGFSVNRPRTIISPVSSVAISTEAKNTLKSLLDPKNKNVNLDSFFGDFEFVKNAEDGYTAFGFKPDQAQTYKKLCLDQKLLICTKNGLDLSVIDKMYVSNNEFLKNLNLSQPVSETVFEKNEQEK